METLRQHIKPGHVYRRSDLEYYSSAIDRHLGMLTKDGSLIKLSQGVYYAPKSSKFGLVPPDDVVLVESFLKDSDFLMVKPNVYNTLGLGLTQLYNTTWVYNHKRKGEFKFNGKSFEFKIKSSFPNQLTKEFLLVDLLNNLDELAEDQNQTIKRIPEKLSSFNNEELMRVAQQYGSGRTKQLLKSIYRNKIQHA
ncbi:MAG: hypothetical protein KJS45_11420 [Bacteroidetes bacterium]|nr:hypothetical protein [Bacteroidota bacterium]